MKTLNVGMIGYGFMGKAHSNGFSQVNHFFDLKHRLKLKAICGRTRNKAELFAKTWGYDDTETDWRKIIERKDIDIVDICTPNDSHAEIAIAAAQAGKMIMCKKPLALNG